MHKDHKVPNGVTWRGWPDTLGSTSTSHFDNVLLELKFPQCPLQHASLQYYINPPTTKSINQAPTIQ